jgi:hypothetical protein
VHTRLEVFAFLNNVLIVVDGSRSTIFSISELLREKRKKEKKETIYIVTYRPIARQRLGKHIPTGTNARNKASVNTPP